MGSKDRPADILLRGQSASHETCLNIMATNIYQAATIEGCTADRASAVEMAYT